MVTGPSPCLMKAVAQSGLSEPSAAVCLVTSLTSWRMRAASASLPLHWSTEA